MVNYRLLIIPLLVLSTAAHAHAHFLFIRITESPKQKRIAEVYFSDTATAGDPIFVDKIAGMKLWQQTKPGEFKPLPVDKGKDRLHAALPDTGSIAVVGICEYGVLPRKTPFLLRHFPKAVLGSAKDLEDLRRFGKVPLEIMGKVSDGKLHMTVLREGKPVPHAEIWTLAKDLSGGKLKCDATGKAVWTPPREGWYMVYTSDFKKSAGTHRGKKYEEIRDFATLSFQWPLK